MTTPLETLLITWREIAVIFRRPQPFTLPMFLLFAIIPVYLIIGVIVSDWTLNSPELAWDHTLPLLPAWSGVYVSLFLAALLPVFVVHQQELIRRTVFAYLAIWLVAYACFLVYPTISPQHAEVTGKGFAAWALRTLYDSDVHYNCFPSLHVAQCFLAALTCYCVHRGLGMCMLIWATLVGLSTLFIKQHYIVDVIAGVLLAYAAYFVFLRTYPRDAIPENERRLAPVLAAGAFAVYGLMILIFWFIYIFNLA